MRAWAMVGILILSGCQQTPPYSTPLRFSSPDRPVSCLSSLPENLPLGDGVISPCDGLLWQMESQYWSALNQPCVIVTRSARKARWCFEGTWRVLPQVLAHE